MMFRTVTAATIAAAILAFSLPATGAIWAAAAAPADQRPHAAETKANPAHPHKAKTKHKAKRKTHNAAPRSRHVHRRQPQG